MQLMKKLAEHPGCVNCAISQWSRVGYMPLILPQRPVVQTVLAGSKDRVPYVNPLLRCGQPFRCQSSDES